MGANTGEMTNDELDDALEEAKKVLEYETKSGALTSLSSMRQIFYRGYIAGVRYARNHTAS